MSDKSTIEWTDATWNPVTGCTKVSAGCKFCYAERVFPRAYGKDRKFTDVRCHPERLDQLLHWKKPRRIFVNSMSDLFHEDVPNEFIDHVFAVMAMSSHHSYQILTKRPAFMLAYLLRVDLAETIGAYECWPLPNVWLGVSVEDQLTADERISLLLQTPAAVRFVSYEPALWPVDFTESLNNSIPQSPKLDWLIAGGESGPHARPSHPDWFRSARDQCAAAGIAFFFKQWGEWYPGESSHLQLRCDHNWPDGTFSVRCGKRAAGRVLDGRTHDEYPV